MSGSYAFVEANNGTRSGNNLGRSTGTYDTISRLGQSCDARDANGQPCAIDSNNTLTCAATHDTGWGGRGKDFGSSRPSYRCVYADPCYYGTLSTKCWDVWRDGVPNYERSCKL